MDVNVDRYLSKHIHPATVLKSQRTGGGTFAFIKLCVGAANLRPWWKDAGTSLWDNRVLVQTGRVGLEPPCRLVPIDTTCPRSRCLPCIMPCFHSIGVYCDCGGGLCYSIRRHLCVAGKLEEFTGLNVCVSTRSATLDGGMIIFTVSFSNDPPPPPLSLSQSCMLCVCVCVRVSLLPKMCIDMVQP